MPPDTECSIARCGTVDILRESSECRLRHGTRFRVHPTTPAGHVDETPPRLNVTIPSTLPSEKSDTAGEGICPLSGAFEAIVMRVPFGGTDNPSVRPSSSA